MGDVPDDRGAGTDRHDVGTGDGSARPGRGEDATGACAVRLRHGHPRHGRPRQRRPTAPRVPSESAA